MLQIHSRKTNGKCDVTGKEGIEVVTIQCGDAAKQTIAISELVKFVRFATPAGDNSPAKRGSATIRLPNRGTIEIVLRSTPVRSAVRTIPTKKKEIA